MKDIEEGWICGVSCQCERLGLILGQASWLRVVQGNVSQRRGKSIITREANLRVVPRSDTLTGSFRILFRGLMILSSETLLPPTQKHTHVGIDYFLFAWSIAPQTGVLLFIVKWSKRWLT